MDKRQQKQRLEELREIIRHHNYRYYVLNDPLVSDFEFDQLEELKQDVFDLRLELKLAKDKIKSGNFNMVQIYVDGLLPRVQKIWDKLGRKPKKLEMSILSSELQDRTAQ